MMSFNPLPYYPQLDFYYNSLPQHQPQSIHQQPQPIHQQPQPIQPQLPQSQSSIPQSTIPQSTLPQSLYQYVESKQQLPSIYIANQQSQLPQLPQQSLPQSQSQSHSHSHFPEFYYHQNPQNPQHLPQFQHPQQYYQLPNHNFLHPQINNLSTLSNLLPHPIHQQHNTTQQPHPSHQSHSQPQLSQTHYSKPSSLSSASTSTSTSTNLSVYPLSPASINESTKDDYHNNNLPIDYSSIVSYTISPSLKRRRKQKIINSKKSSSITSSPTTSSTELNYPCPKCDKIFQKPYNLKSHMKTHSNEKPFQCSTCPKTFARSHDKKRHELLHGGEKNFKCQGFLKNGITKWGCGKKFARSDALSRHFRTETGWLCIKPFMDEARDFEESGNDNHQHLQNDNVNNDELDNSNLIRKLIQGR